MSAWEQLADVPHRLDYRLIDGVRTRCLEAGEGRPLVLLHGTGGHLEAYVRNIGPLSRRYRVLAFDVPGHGFSDSPPSYRYDWEGLSGHVLAALDEFDARDPVLIGEGLGAQLAEWLVIHRPERVAAAVLACTLIVPSEDAELLVPPGDMERFQELSRRALDHPTAELLRERMEWLMFDPASVTDELVALRLAMWSKPEVREAQRRILASYVTPPEQGGLRVARAQAQGIETPLLVVWSSTNPLMGAEAARTFSGYPAGRCEYVELERAGLWPQFEQASRFNELVTGFVDSLDGDGRR